jgi:hypothetical protein
MSSTHNALRQAEAARPADNAAAPGPQLMPVDCPPTSSPYSNLPLVALIGVVLLISGLLMWGWVSAGGRELKARARTYDSTVNPASDPTRKSLVPPLLAPSAPAMERTPAVTSNGAGDKEKLAPEAAKKLATVIAPSKPAPVTYKLQGILFQPGQSSAVINGKSVYAGERVGDARVVSIDRDTVVLVDAEGQTNLLELP